MLKEEIIEMIEDDEGDENMESEQGEDVQIESEDGIEMEMDDNVEDEGYYDDDIENVQNEQDEYVQDYEVDGSENNLETKEEEAMIADTYWGMEVYLVAFSCFCCMQKTKCCGFWKGQKREKNGFGYNGYAEYRQQDGFKRVFGNVDDEEKDVEMGGNRIDQNESDEDESFIN